MMILRRRHRHKFSAIQADRDGILFASRREARGYDAQKQRQLAGQVLFFLRQVPFHLPGGVKYVVDFVTFEADGSVHFIDYKGVRTESYKAKKRIVEAMFPVEIEER